MTPKTRTSPRLARASTQAVRMASATSKKATTKSPSPNKRARQASPKRNTITIKKVLLTSSSGSTIGPSTNDQGKGVRHQEIDLESDTSVLSGPEVKEDEMDTSDASSTDSITDGDDVGVPDFEQVINAPQPKTLITSSGRLTARQRAMLDETVMEDGEGEESMEDANLVIPAKRALTEEEMLQKSEMARRRKHQREQALEERKVATIHRILAKQSARRAIGQKGRPKGVTGTKEEEGGEEKVHADSDTPKCAREDLEEYLRKPMQADSVRYHVKGSESYLVVPRIILTFGKPRVVKDVKCECCGEDKKYNHSATGSPVCSLECYKQVKVR
jgi:PAPA-1-like protein/HIT zinc finger protein